LDRASARDQACSYQELNNQFNGAAVIGDISFMGRRFEPEKGFRFAQPCVGSRRRSGNTFCTLLVPGENGHYYQLKEAVLQPRRWKSYVSEAG
jgi:hypothetical protein